MESEINQHRVTDFVFQDHWQWLEERRVRKQRSSSDNIKRIANGSNGPWQNYIALAIRIIGQLENRIRSKLGSRFIQRFWQFYTDEVAGIRRST